MIGVDILKIDRIESLIARRGLSFVREMLNTNESSPATLAGIFTCKEAVSKAIGSGLTREFLKNSSIYKNERNKPYLLYKNRLYEVSISHDGSYAISVASGKSVLYFDKKLINLLPNRDEKGDKKTFGKLAIVGGDITMTGCMALASDASFRMGVGYSMLYVPREIVEILQIKTTEAIVRGIEDGLDIDPYDAIVIGMGMKKSPKNLLDRVGKTDAPVLIDADGFKHFKNNLKDIKKLVITPHYGEASYLLDEDISNIKNNPLKYAKVLSERFNCVAVLKGAPTYVVYLDRVYENKSGNNGLAKAGSGDVLSGIIGALLANHLNPFDAARLGVYMHGLSADYMAEKLGKRSLMPSDVIDGLCMINREVEYEL